MINAKKPIRQVKSTLRGSMYTPALIPGSQLTEPVVKACPLPDQTLGINESARAAVTAAMTTTK